MCIDCGYLGIRISYFSSHLQNSIMARSTQELKESNTFS